MLRLFYCGALAPAARFKCEIQHCSPIIAEFLPLWYLKISSVANVILESKSFAYFVLHTMLYCEHGMGVSCFVSVSKLDTMEAELFRLCGLM